MIGRTALLAGNPYAKADDVKAGSLRGGSDALGGGQQARTVLYEPQARSNCSSSQVLVTIKDDTTDEIQSFHHSHLGALY